MKNGFERALIKCTTETVRQAIYATTTEVEARQIMVNVVTDETGSLSLSINGPKKIVSKISSALA